MALNGFGRLQKKPVERRNPPSPASFVGRVCERLQICHTIGYSIPISVGTRQNQSIAECVQCASVIRNMAKTVDLNPLVRVGRRPLAARATITYATDPRQFCNSHHDHPLLPKSLFGHHEICVVKRCQLWITDLSRRLSGRIAPADRYPLGIL